MPGQVVANGPVAFSDGSGRAFSIPLSLLDFDANGAIRAERWPLYLAHQALLDVWLPYLQAQGVISEGEAAAPVEAMIITAKQAGAAGNTILLTIDNVRPNPADNTIIIFDATVTETSSYTGLTPATIKTVLGSVAGGGERPGLVFVSSAGDPQLPKEDSYPLTGGGAGAASTVDIPNTDESATAFTLTVRQEGAEGDHTTVEIEEVDAAASTFTLIATWNKTVDALEAGGLAAAFAFEIEVAPPASGVLAAPAPGEYVLGGGTGAADAKAATITLIAAP